jgi:hypothetical protein
MPSYVSMHSAPAEPHFRGYRVEYNRCKVLGPGGAELDPRFDLFNHSPDGFEWGYEGSGPAQLALAILAHVIQLDTLAVRMHQEFKREFVGHFDKRWWWLPVKDVRDWAREWVDAHRAAAELPKRTVVFPDEAIAAVAELIESNAENFVAQFEESGGITSTGAPWCPSCNRQACIGTYSDLNGVLPGEAKQGSAACDICGERFRYFTMEFDGKVYYATRGLVVRDAEPDPRQS